MSRTHEATLRSLSQLFIVTNAAVYVFLAVAIVPYWQTLSGPEVQRWFADHFDRFSIMMVPVHLLAIVTTVMALVASRRRARSDAVTWIVLVVGLFGSQAFNFTLYAVVLNPDLSSETLSDADALSTLDDWATYHTVRTILVVASAVAAVILTTRAMRRGELAGPSAAPA
ncbi:MAG: hypothetical protein AAGA99_25300 [Actinomycetota bacterium]